MSEILPDLIALGEVVQASGDDLGSVFGEAIAAAVAPQLFAIAVDRTLDAPDVGVGALGASEFEVGDEAVATVPQNETRLDQLARLRAKRWRRW